MEFQLVQGQIIEWDDPAAPDGPPRYRETYAVNEALPKMEEAALRPILLVRWILKATRLADDDNAPPLTVMAARFRRGELFDKASRGLLQVEIGSVRGLKAPAVIPGW
jgi:hypothetical protein